MSDQPCHMHEPDERDRDDERSTEEDVERGFDGEAPRGEHAKSRVVEPAQDYIRDRDEIAQ